MQLIDREWNEYLGNYQNVWLADDASGISANFDPDGSELSAIFVISEGAIYVKNCSGKWQKVGTTEVI